MISFILMVNKQGQTRLSSYYDWLEQEEKLVLEGEIVRRCLSRGEKQTSFMKHGGYQIVYRRYASLFFIIGCKEKEEVNELGLLDLIHMIVETFDQYFQNVCELDIMFNLDKAYFILDEIIGNGEVMEMNKGAVLEPIKLLDRTN
eukprot:maker-scaffold_46-snap-gene-1.94-mRNA-1 protein AED:0.04 eAED:0.04 QI:33/1/1/1/0.5/0.33/3/133/144